MDVKRAVLECLPFIKDCDKLPDNHPEFGKDHLQYMADTMLEMKTFDTTSRFSFLSQRLSEIVNQENPQKRADMALSLLVEVQAVFHTNEKAMRWLGWFQACLVLGAGTTLEDMKRINKES